MIMVSTDVILLMGAKDQAIRERCSLSVILGVVCRVNDATA